MKLKLTSVSEARADWCMGLKQASSNVTEGAVVPEIILKQKLASLPPCLTHPGCACGLVTSLDVSQHG